MLTIILAVCALLFLVALWALWAVLRAPSTGNRFVMSKAESVRQEAKPRSRISWQRILGALFFLFGWLNGWGALNMTVDVQTDVGPVANLELMHQRSVALGVSGISLLIGVLFMLFGKSDAERNAVTSGEADNTLAHLTALRAQGVLSDDEFLEKVKNLKG